MSDEEAGSGGVPPERDEAVDTGGDADAVRAALLRARAAAQARKVAARPTGPAGRRRGSRPAPPGGSGAHPDARDPQLFGGLIDRLVAERGWQVPLSVGGVMGRWDEIVGADMAAHCRPETFAEGILTVRADSTAWATQVRLLVPALLGRLAEDVGEGTVTKVVVRGPSGPSWTRGRRVASGSVGPRDTYG